MKLYLCGPMSGLPEFNHSAFNTEAARLRGLGHEVENPAENAPPPCGTYQGYMRQAVRSMLTCDCIATLPGYRESRGARIETELAAKLAIPVIQAADFISAVSPKSYSSFSKANLEMMAAKFDIPYEEFSQSILVAHTGSPEGPIAETYKTHLWPDLNASINQVPVIKRCGTCQHGAISAAGCQYAKDCDATFDLWQPRVEG